MRSLFMWRSEEADVPAGSPAARPEGEGKGMTLGAFRSITCRLGGVGTAKRAALREPVGLAVFTRLARADFWIEWGYWGEDEGE